MIGFDFDCLAPARIPVIYQGKRYVLCEASAGDVMAWRTAQFRDARYDREGNPTERRVQDVFESQTLLVSMCLYFAEADGTAPVKDGDLDTSRRVPLAKVRAWPERVVDKLLDTAMEISGLKVTPTKEKSEADFVAACTALAGWVEKPEESGQWHEWMMGEVEKALAASPCRKRESAEKNGLTATAAVSA